MKIEGISLMRPPEAEAASVGATTFQTITLGGIDEKARDATNEMSYIAVDASMAVHTIQPTIVVRYHPQIDPNFIDKCTDCIRSGIGHRAHRGLGDRPRRVWAQRRLRHDAPRHELGPSGA